MKHELTKRDDCPFCKTELVQDGTPRWNWIIGGIAHSSLRQLCSRCGYWEQCVWTDRRLRTAESHMQSVTLDEPSALPSQNHVPTPDTRSLYTFLRLLTGTRTQKGD
jgi:hypothetical protein